MSAPFANVLSVLRENVTSHRPGRRWATPGAMSFDLDPRHRQSAALDLIDRKLVDLADGRTQRLMVFMPPQEGKSQKVSRRTPAWLLYDDPTLRVVIVSYDDERARRWGREVKRDIEQHPVLAAKIHLRADSKAAGRWQTEQGGGIYCAGIAGGITGEPADVIIIDDPVKGPAEASSYVYRDKAWATWEATISPRLSGRSRVVLCMTRWHEDDLAGRLLANEPGQWEVLSIPAIAEHADPLGRKPGEEFPSIRDREPGYFTNLQRVRTPHVFNALYQQHPAAAEGNLFKRDKAQYWAHGLNNQLRLDGHAAGVDLRDCLRFITIDLAASVKTSADFTVGGAWAIAPSGDLLLLDMVRDRVPPTKHWDLIAPLRQQWLQPGDVTYVESRMFGTTFVYEAGRAGIPIAELEADADKITRAIPAANRWQAGTLWLPPGRPWLPDLIDELAAFDTGPHDDIVDMVAYAARVAAAHWIAPFPDVITDTHRALNQGLDYMTVQY